MYDNAFSCRDRNHFDIEPADVHNKPHTQFCFKEIFPRPKRTLNDQPQLTSTAITAWIGNIENRWNANANPSIRQQFRESSLIFLILVQITKKVSIEKTDHMEVRSTSLSSMIPAFVGLLTLEYRRWSLTCSDKHREKSGRATNHRLSRRVTRCALYYSGENGGGNRIGKLQRPVNLDLEPPPK